MKLIVRLLIENTKKWDLIKKQIYRKREKNIKLDDTVWVCRKPKKKKNIINYYEKTKNQLKWNVFKSFKK